MLKNDGDPKRFLLMYLFCEQSLAITLRSVKAFLGQYKRGKTTNSTYNTHHRLGLVLFFF